MIHPGLCSLTLGHLSPLEVISLCQETGLTHIEWWGRDKGHVPTGDIETAQLVGEATRDAGIKVSTYGSYYCVGESEAEETSFDAVLNTAVALGAPAIRVWAGTKGSDVVTPDQRQAVIDDALRIADQASEFNVRIIFEYHQDTLSDSNDSTIQLADSLKHPFIDFSWQALTDIPIKERVKGLQSILPRLRTVHVFNWTRDKEANFLRHPLSDALDEWQTYFCMIKQTKTDHVALLEFVPNDSIEQFKIEAHTLNKLMTSNNEK